MQSQKTTCNPIHEHWIFQFQVTHTSIVLPHTLICFSHTLLGFFSLCSLFQSSPHPPTGFICPSSIFNQSRRIPPSYCYLLAIFRIPCAEFQPQTSTCIFCFQSCCLTCRVLLVSFFFAVHRTFVCISHHPSIQPYLVY